MPLAPGTRCGPYEIVSPLGEGGMGEVYRAADSRLGREVALKVLPAAFARDADRMARFAREAKILASLNHPYIASVYGLEDAVGTRALGMELVEGLTLADRLTQGALPTDDGAADPSSSPNMTPSSPTLTWMATEPGIILGTAAYMSPEQAKGKALHRGTDIWAFGCVLLVSRPRTDATSAPDRPT